MSENSAGAPAPGGTGSPGQGKPRIFYGWYIVGAVFLTQTVGCGLIFYNLSILLKAFVAEGTFSVGITSAATAVFFISSGFAGLGVGWLLDRFDPRFVMTGGAIIAAVALAAIGHVTQPWQLYAFYVCFGIGNAALVVIPGMTIVARWFTRQRSKAIAYASTGLSFGGIVFSPLSASLVQSLGLASAGPWLGLMLMAGILPIAWIFLRPSPQSIGEAPDGDPPRLRADGSLEPPDGVSFSDAIRSRFFIFCTLAYVFSMMAQVGTLAHQFRLVSLRADDHIAALAISTMAASSIAGRLIGGWLLQRISPRAYLMGIFCIQGAAFFSFAFAHAHWQLFGVSSLFGLTVGNLQMMQPLLMAEAFGLKAYARILSLAQMITTCANAAGPALLGFLYETTVGGYQTAFLVISMAPVLGFLSFLAAGPVSAPLKSQGLSEDDAF